VVGDLEERIDAIYAGPPEAFVAARTALAKELRTEGDREAAEEVAGLRRPTLAAWALNQVRRTDPEGLDRFADAAEALRDAQDRALAGDKSGDLRGAVAKRRDAASRLVRAAGEALREIDRDPDPHVPAMAATIEAAAADPEVGELLRQGRLVSEHGPAGFGDPAAASGPRRARGPAKPKSRRSAKTAAADAADDADEARRKADATARADAARQEAAAAAQALKTAERNASAASAAATRARQRVEDLDAKLRAARHALTETERSERSAQKELDAARRRHPAAGPPRGRGGT
jgi:hypothetical protein